MIDDIEQDGQDKRKRQAFDTVRPATVAAVLSPYASGVRGERDREAKLEEAVGLARAIDLDVFVRAEMLGEPVRGTCHSFQPGMIDQAVRVMGQTRDFTNDAGALLRGH